MCFSFLISVEKWHGFGFMCIHIQKVVSYGLIMILVLLDFRFQGPIMCLMTEIDAHCNF